MALRALEEDHQLFLEGNVFTEELIVDWIRVKRCEESQIRTRPHPYEIELYFDL